MAWLLSSLIIHSLSAGYLGSDKSFKAGGNLW